MNAVAARLKVLKAQTGHVAHDTLSDRLRAALGLRDRITVRRSLVPPAGHEIAKGLYLVESRCANPLPPTIRLPMADEVIVARERIVCFDTETTGLAGGVGTKAFMIGVAMYCADQLLIRQLYLTTLGGERAMLTTFASWLAQDSVFVSYNGRAYDATLLKARFRMHRLQHPFQERLHADLLYPVRRAYRGVWENCRLQTIERELLGIRRQDDLPGAEAPAAWLSFLRGQSSANLRRVLAHNDQDVRTLATLLDRLHRE